MYLSRIELETRLNDTKKAIMTPQVMHAAVENCFLSGNNEKDRKLWRLDKLQNKIYLLILSPSEPDFDSFSKQFCQAGTKGEIKQYKQLLLKIQNGQTWRFRLRGNATHSVANKKGERGKVHAHVSVGYQREWLTKKAPACGFSLEGLFFDVIETDRVRFWKNPKDLSDTSANRPVTLGISVYEGDLRITEADLFKQSLLNGIGRAKAYGCGLLTIADPR